MKKLTSLLTVLTVVLLALAIVNLIYAEAPILAGEELVIAHITDTHISLNQKRDQGFSDVIWAANQQAQIVFITGDVTDGPNKKKNCLMMTKFVDILQNSTIPCFVVRGDHDDPNSFQEIVGPLEWVCDTEKYRIIGIDTLNVNFDKLQEWLQSDKILIVLGHQPLDCRIDSCMKHSVALKLRELFKQNNVLLYISGHNHHPEIKIDSYSGTVLIVGGAAKDGRYGLITLKDSVMAEVLSIQIKVDKLSGGKGLKLYR